ncbi:hypothetical protein F0L74_27410 [Chitinophaga agrisoli]|uniref:VCBS repeat protein n=1 Tax=Chitinophaga agrisoli TaxID=2607653 RepID=A0A5B2VP00_9BACT|nr:hypothetical protein [Chitinophaga agrisoli]KAA2239917.1 hypothetical protein F0L74_27410 [Chitinophaga agrisoli]
MRTSLITALLAVLWSMNLSAQANQVASLLFKNVKTSLTDAEKAQIATKLGFVLSGNKDQPFAQDKDSKEYPFNAMVYPADMNKDGKEEIFVVFGNTFTSGNTGSSVVLFIRNGAGTYTEHLGFPGMAPDVLATVSKGYPDLLIGGPGFEYPVWRWDGKTYNSFKSVKDSEYEKLKKMNIEELSKTYVQNKNK